jgi:hypothetical protein
MRGRGSASERKQCLLRACRMSANKDGRLLTITVCQQIFQVFTLTCHLQLKAYVLKQTVASLELVTGN